MNHRPFFAIVTALSAVTLYLALPAWADASWFGPGAANGTVQDNRLTEISGLAVSNQNPGVLWVHNDSGGSARVFAMAADGTHLGAYTLGGASAVDWEDMAIGPGPVPGVDYLYIADTGDNDRNRSSVTIYRVPEPAVNLSQSQNPVTATLSGVEALPVVYPGSKYDCESLLVDPSNGNLVMVTRDRANEGFAYVFSYPAASQTPGVTFTLELQTSLAYGTDIKGGDVSRGGDKVILRPAVGDVAVDGLLWHRSPGTPLWKVFDQPFCLVPLVGEPQGEAVSFESDGSGYYTISEGSSEPVYFYARDASFPGAPVLVAPSDGATDVDFPADLQVQVSDPNGDPLDVTFYGEQDRPDFSIVALPDTQYYVSSLNGGTPAMFNAQTDWIVANKDARNIAFVTHLGDCVQNGDNGGDDSEWLLAIDAMYRLEDPLTTLLQDGLPYGVAVGNHEQSPFGDADGTSIFYNQYFGEAHFSGRGYYGGHYGSNNDNHYQLFSASGLDFIIIHLEYDTSQDAAVLTWADGLLQTYGARQAIVVTHHLIGTGNPASFGTQGQAIYDALKGNPNLILMLGGHVSGEGRRKDTFNGNTVHSVLADFQNRPNGGDGWLRILEFSPNKNELRVKTYSPTRDEFETDASSEFTLHVEMGGLEVLGQSLATPSGSTASFSWTGLAYSTEHSWAVEVTDPTGHPVTSPVWQFTTRPSNYSPEANDQLLATNEDTALLITLTASDAENDPLTYSVATTPANGVLSGSAPSLTYTSNGNYHGPDSFTFVANDGQSDSAPATISITVNPINDQPVAVAQSVATDQAIPLGITLGANDVDGDSLTYTVTSGPGNGTLSGTAPSLTYTPDPAFIGSDSFLFVAHDGTVNSAPAMITITVNPVNQAPVANPQSVVTSEDTDLLITLTASDAENDPLTYSVATTPANGTLSGSAPDLLYTPAADYYGPDSFTFVGNDGQSDSTPATISITVNPINDPPVAVAGPDQIVYPDAQVTFDGSSSTDAESDPLTFTWLQFSGPPVVLSDPNAVQPSFVAPAVSQDTTLQFSLEVSDGALSSVDSVDVTVSALDYNAFVSQEPTILTYGTVTGTIEGTMTSDDNLVQTVSETVSASKGRKRLQVEYLLSTIAPPGLITNMQLNLVHSWTNRDSGEVLQAFIWNRELSDWEDIGLDLLGVGVFTAIGAAAENYVDEDKNMRVMFSDSSAIQREKADTLTIDLLYAQIDIDNPEPDTVPPGAPTGLVGTAGEFVVDLDWADNPEPDLAGYFVYRSDTMPGPYVALNLDPVAASDFADATVVRNNTYFYRVAAIDFSSNESALSGLFEATPVDLPPVPPSGLTASAGNNEVTLLWAHNTEPDLAGYDVYRSDAPGGPYTLLVSTMVDENSVVDATVVNGFTYYYVVTSIDTQDNASVSSAEVNATPTAQQLLHVQNIAMQAIRAGKNWKGEATVLVTDQQGLPLVGATVSGDWLYQTQFNSSSVDVTDASGIAVLTSAPEKAKRGETFLFTVTAVDLAGFAYDSASNSETDDSIEIP